MELDRDYVIESFEVGGRTYTQKQVSKTKGSRTVSASRRKCARCVMPNDLIATALLAVEGNMVNDVERVVQVEGCFSQPNGIMCQKMVGWAVDVTRCSTCAYILPLVSRPSSESCDVVAKWCALHFPAAIRACTCRSSSGVLCGLHFACTHGDPILCRWMQ